MKNIANIAVINFHAKRIKCDKLEWIKWRQFMAKSTFKIKNYEKIEINFIYIISLNLS